MIIVQSLESVLRPFVEIVTFAIDVAAGVIIDISAIFALISFFKIFGKPRPEQIHEKEAIRLRLARGMLLALNFEVGRDILRTILMPGIQELTILAAIVAIRIALSWSLSKELDIHSEDKEILKRQNLTKIKGKNNQQQVSHSKHCI